MARGLGLMLEWAEQGDVLQHMRKRWSLSSSSATPVRYAGGNPAPCALRYLRLRVIPEGPEVAAPIRSLAYVAGDRDAPHSCLLACGGQPADKPDMLTLLPLLPASQACFLTLPASFCLCRGSCMFLPKQVIQTVIALVMTLTRGVSRGWQILEVQAGRWRRRLSVPCQGFAQRGDDNRMPSRGAARHSTTSGWPCSVQSRAMCWFHLKDRYHVHSGVPPLLPLSSLRAASLFCTTSPTCSLCRCHYLFRHACSAACRCLLFIRTLLQHHLSR